MPQLCSGTAQLNLCHVFINSFNAALCQHAISQCFKDSTIIPLPKSTKISSLSDYRPISQASVIFTTAHLKHRTLLYYANRSAEDAAYLALQHYNTWNHPTFIHVFFYQLQLSAFYTKKLVQLFNRYTRHRHQLLHMMKKATMG